MMDEAAAFHRGARRGGVAGVGEAALTRGQAETRGQARLVYNWRFIDLVCRPRAAHVVRQTRILRYLYPPVTLLPVRHSVFICQRW
jgi:hypothetical protein